MSFSFTTGTIGDRDGVPSIFLSTRSSPKVITSTLGRKVVNDTFDGSEEKLNGLVTSELPYSNSARDGGRLLGLKSMASNNRKVSPVSGSLKTGDLSYESTSVIVA